MKMYRDCVQCGTSNKSGEHERNGIFKRFPFECEDCGATGVYVTHKRAGVVGSRGGYFNE